MNAYSEMKAAWHTGQIEELRKGKHPPPKHVHMILSDLCNQDCHFCSYRMSNGISSQNFVEIKDGQRNRNPNRMIPYEKAIEILDDMAEVGVQAVQFTGGGEPTVHPQHMEIFGHALNRGLKCALVTNGVLLRKDWEAVLPKFSWIRVSIDAGSPEVYADVRRVNPAMYGRALTNVAKLADQIEKEGSPCLLGCGYVVTRENWQDLYEGVAAIRETGAAYVRLSAMFSTSHYDYYDGIDSEIRETISRAKRLETKDFKVLDLYDRRISDLKQEAPDYPFCGYQNFTTYIGGNQKVYRCCSTSYTDHGEVGDLTNMRFKDWLASEERLLLYKNFDARSCNLCQFNGQNRVINYLVGEPTHVEFV